MEEKNVGNQTYTCDALYKGKVFRTRTEFKQEMALYAMRHKFYFRTTRSTPDCMVTTCVTSSCKWRVYAVKIKNVGKYEIRKAILQHSCSIDDRAGIYTDDINVYIYIKYNFFCYIYALRHKHAKAELKDFCYKIGNL